MPDPVLPPIGYRKAIYLSVAQAIRLAVASQPVLSQNVQFPGTRQPAAGVEEWASIFPIGEFPYARPMAMWHSRILFQVSCASLLAEGRADRNSLRPYEIADLIMGSLSKKDVQVYDYTLEGQRLGRLGVISISEGTSRYVSARSETASGLPNSQGIGIPTNTHLVALTFRAVTDVHI